MTSHLAWTDQSQKNRVLQIPQADPQQSFESENKKVSLSYQNKILKILLALVSILSFVLAGLYFSTLPNTNVSSSLEQSVTPFFIEKQINDEVKQILASNRFYDIHSYIKDDHFLRKHKVIQQSDRSLISQRQLLKFSQTNQQIETLIKTMRKQSFKIEGKSKQIFRHQYFNDELAHDAYFFDELNKNPSQQNYLEAQFYRYDKKYNISQYGEELPLCAIMIGKNNKKVVQKMYDSIENQNYTNYKVIHIDDNSNDGTIKEVKALIQSSKVLSKRVTLIVQPRQMNSLHNRNFSYSFCGENDIIVDMDSDDWLIGKQVFQLINTVYQQGGNSYNISQGKDTWAVYFNLIKHGKGQTYYYLQGNVPLKVIQKQAYRVSAPTDWRTTHLRTFLHKIYNKIDSKDFIDPMTSQPFLIRQDVFIQSAILELSAPKHIKFIDQFVYFYQEFPGKKDLDFVKYAQKMARSLPPYNPLGGLDDKVTRNYAFQQPQTLLDEKKKFSQIAKLKFETTKKQILNLVRVQKENQQEMSDFPLK